MAIKTVHHIDWHQVTYDQMSLPGFSLLAYIIHLQQKGFMPISGNNKLQLDICNQLINCDAELFQNSALFIQRTVEQTCQQRDNDIMFVVDASGSVGAEGFARVRTFLKDVNKYMGSNSRIGLVRYASSSDLIHRLDDGLENFDQIVTSMDYTSGGTGTGAALKMAYEHILLRGRRDATKTIVLMTDGYTADQAVYDAIIETIKSSPASLNMQAIGFGRTMNPNINIEDLKAYNQPPLILDDISFDDPASALVQDICAGTVKAASMNDMSICTNEGHSMNIVVDISRKNTFTIETTNDAYVVYSFSSQKPSDFFNDGQFTLKANVGKTIDSGDEPQKIYVNVYPDKLATGKTCVEINSALTRSAATEKIGAAKTCHDNETCQANGDGTGSCVCNVPLENGACPYGSYFPAQYALYAKRALFNTLESKLSAATEISGQHQKLKMRYLKRIKQAVNSYSNSINSHKTNCKTKNNGESHRQIDAETLLDLIKEDNLCKMKKTLKRSLKGGAQAHGCGSSAVHSAVNRAEKLFQKLLARDAELKEQCNH
jgi:hypothetical protein